MIITAYKTHKIALGDTLEEVCSNYLPNLTEKSVVAISSKVVGICEGRMIKNDFIGKKELLAKQEAEYYLPLAYNQYDFMITINHNMLVASAGIDESNSNGFLSLWPKNPQQSADEIREYLIKKFKIKHLGVVITDSKLTPLRWGVTGVALSHSGFRALNDYRGKPDIFGRPMQAAQANTADSLAVAAVAEMGEGAEQKPLAVITDAKFVHFQKRNPTQKELDGLKMELEEDVFASLLTAVDWKKGK